MSEENELKVDKHRLDREWALQAERMHARCLDLADARKRAAEAKAELDVVYAEKDRDVRLHPGRYELDKLTEKTIEGTVLCSREYREATKRLIEAKHEVDSLEAVVTALHHKKSALQELVALHAMGYFAEPREAGARAVRDAARSDRALSAFKGRTDNNE